MFEFGNRSLEVYRRLEGLEEDCKKSCPGAEASIKEMAEDLKGMQSGSSTADMGKIFKKLYGLICSKQDDFKCIAKNCGTGLNEASRSYIKGMGCVCDDCPATVDIFAAVLSAVGNTGGAQTMST